jgi:HSP20 family protein
MEPVRGARRNAAAVEPAAGRPLSDGHGHQLCRLQAGGRHPETDAEFLVKVDLPDVKKEDIKIQMVNGVLTVEGERRKEQEETGKRFHKVEREYGRFVRRFELPSEVDAGKVRAAFKHGVLNVALPKAAIVKPAPIEISVG